MKDAAVTSGLSFAEIGQRMGEADRVSARNKVNHLLNHAKNPGIMNLMLFCEAVKIGIQDLLKDP